MRTRLLLATTALLLAACGGSSDVAVDDPGAEPVPDATATADESPTPSPSPSQSPSPSPDPSPAEAESPEPTVAPVVDPCDNPPAANTYNGILLSSPLDGDTLVDGDPVVGCGSTFEANFQWEVVYDNSSVVDAGFGTMTCGTGCIGTFSEPLDLTATGPATLTVYESSAQDGSRINEVERDITVQ